MATPRRILVFLLALFLFFPDAALADDITIAKNCVDRSPLFTSPSSVCGYLNLSFTVNTLGGVGQSNCTLSSGNSSEFLVPVGAQQSFRLSPQAPVGQNRIRCNVTKTSFVEKPFTVHGALINAFVDTPSTVYMNSTVSLKIMSVNYDWPDDAAPGFSACWNLRDPSSGQVIAQWVCSNATTLYQIPASLPIGQSQFVLLLQAQNYESLFKYIPVTIKSSPIFSFSIYPESQIMQTAGGRLDYTVSVRAFSSAADLTASWSDERVTLDGKPSSVSIHMDAGKTEKFSLTFDVPAATTGCEADCPQQKFSIVLTDQYGNSQTLTGGATLTDRYTSSFSISPESLGEIAVQPGYEKMAEVTLTNTGKLADVYSAVLMGDAASYSSISPQTMNLAAESSGKYTITVKGPSSLPSGQMSACFSSGNQPSIQKCAKATVNLGVQGPPITLLVQPRALAVFPGENGTIDVTVASSMNEAVISGIIESTCAEWLSNTEWVTLPRTISRKYTNKIYVKPSEVETCTVKITLRAQGAPPKSATVEITSSIPEIEINAITELSMAILSNATTLQQKAKILKNTRIDAAFINDIEVNATSLAENCRNDVAKEQYSAAQTSCKLAQADIKRAMEQLDYGSRSLRVSKPFYISPVAIASVIAIALSVVYLIVIAPAESL